MGPIHPTHSMHLLNRSVEHSNQLDSSCLLCKTSERKEWNSSMWQGIVEMQRYLQGSNFLNDMQSALLIQLDSMNQLDSLEERWIQRDSNFLQDIE